MSTHPFSTAESKTRFGKPSILFTGGGSAGHVTPNLPLIRRCLKDHWQVFYMGSSGGIEQHLMEKENIPFFSIRSGKLRRYFSWKNWVDPFNILIGIIQSFYMLKKLNPTLIFSKGGFVSFPVVMAGKLLGIPSIVHESDLTPGLANRLCFLFAKKICLTFPETLRFISNFAHKSVALGMIIREEAHAADPNKGRIICQFPPDKKIIFVYAGSQGSERINQAIHRILPELLNDFNIIHCCGKGKLNNQLMHLSGYLQFEYLHETFYHLLACADLVISRSGSNTLSELLLFQKPHILIPLSQKVSRGEQGFNAAYFSKKGTSLILEEEQLNDTQLLNTIHKTLNEAAQLRAAMQQYNLIDGTDKVYQLIKNEGAVA